MSGLTNSLLWSIPYDTPISTYRIVQTIGNTILGGANTGWINELYLVAPDVINPISNPTATGINIDLK